MTARPNVLLVTVDQWPGPLLGAEGHPVIETPTLDALAADGTRFSAAYSECPVCVPARRTLMTGLSPRAHGDRVFDGGTFMPEGVPTLADVFAGAGYQSYAVGKLHVFPQRARIGFDDVLLSEEGRPGSGAVDDYEIYCADQGYPGRSYLHGMSNNEYAWRDWHMPEHLHATNWAAEQMARTIRRRDPTRPAFWYLSFAHPHPPLVPLRTYLERYRPDAIDAPVAGDWAAGIGEIPALAETTRDWARPKDSELPWIRRAFYALCTHIDHQLRVVLGTLREEGLLNNTAILFTSDHGDMLGDHGLLAKRVMYDMSARVPMILVPPAGRRPELEGALRDDPVGLADVMPTLCDLAGIPVPAGAKGRSLAMSGADRPLYGECGEDNRATRMIRKGRHKLIWYPAGNRLQLFDLQADPREVRDLAGRSDHAALLRELSGRLAAECHGVDSSWLDADGSLMGFAPGPAQRKLRRELYGQRGLHNPMPPLSNLGRLAQSLTPDEPGES
ncbi:sulfatase-like hydrolase/transferase [Roseivivax sp.]